MWKWIKWALSALAGLLNVLREQRTAAEDAAEEQRRQEDEATVRLEQEIREEVNHVERPSLDDSEDADDPMGVGRWNRNR